MLPGREHFQPRKGALPPPKGAFCPPPQVLPGFLTCRVATEAGVEMRVVVRWGESRASVCLEYDPPPRQRGGGTLEQDPWRVLRDSATPAWTKEK